MVQSPTLCSSMATGLVSGIAATSAHDPAGVEGDVARTAGGFGGAPRPPPRGHWAAWAARPVDGAGPSPSPLVLLPYFPGWERREAGGGRRGGAAEGRPVTSPPSSAWSAEPLGLRDSSSGTCWPRCAGAGLRGRGRCCCSCCWRGPGVA